jgi:hypothetical protein
MGKEIASLYPTICTEGIMKKDFYIYNPTQAGYFIYRGLQPIEIGQGSKGDLYIRFKRDANSDAIFAEWCEICKAKKPLPVSVLNLTQKMIFRRPKQVNDTTN